MEPLAVNTKITIAFLNTQKIIEYKCLCFSNNYQKKFDKNLEK